MPNDYIPRPDGDFDAWMRNFVFGSVTFWGNEGFDPPALTELLLALPEWTTAYTAATAAQAAARAATVAKRQARTALERAARDLAQYSQTYPVITDPIRAMMGLSITDPSRTPAASPTSAPLLSITQPDRLTHTLRLADEHTPTRTARPPGIRGAEIWLALTPPGAPLPTDPAAFRFLTLSTRPRHRTSFLLADQGLTAAYMLRWVNTRGEPGPWSGIATATVAA